MANNFLTLHYDFQMIFGFYKINLDSFQFHIQYVKLLLSKTRMSTYLQTLHSAEIPRRRSWTGNERAPDASGTALPA